MVPILLLGLLLALGLWSVWTGSYVLPILLMGALPIGWAILRRPAWAAAATLASTIWSIELVAGSTITPFKLMLLSTSGIMVMGLLSGEALPKPRGHWPILYGVFILWSMLIDIIHSQSGIDFVRIGGIVLTMMVFTHGIRAQKDVDVLVKVLLLLLLVIVGDLFRELGASWWLRSEIVRGHGLLRNPNGTAQTAFGIAGLALALSSLSSLRKVFVATAALTLLVLVLYMTVSRGAVVAAAVALLIFAFTYPRTVRQRVTTLGAITALIAVFVTSMPGAFQARMVGTVETDRGSGKVTIDDSSRTELNLIAVDLLLDNPFLGVGFDAFPIEAERVVGVAYACHNTYLAAGAAYGLVGLALILLVMLSTPLQCLIRLRTAPDEERVFWATYLAMGVGYAALLASAPLQIIPLHGVLGIMPSLLFGTLMTEPARPMRRRDAIARERAALRARLADQGRV